ncbi:NHL domain-containing protein [Forsythia ovata]|uniref:NHL domain-containing protein n=1 Tax=Forsythia ovata TaxID=205694 RepID=A0ABD1X506_9LAMI
MSFRFRRLQQVSRLLPQFYRGNPCGLFGRSIDFFATYSSSSRNVSTGINTRPEQEGCFGERYSTVSETKKKPLSEVDLLSFIRSSLNKPQGASHCWLNKTEGSDNDFKEDGIFLILAGVYCEDSLSTQDDIVITFEKVKSLQQRHPFLQVLAFQHSRSICINNISTHLIQMIIKEYITFPILLSNKHIFETAKGPCFIIFKGFKNPLIYSEKDTDLMVLDKAVSDLNMQDNEKPVISNMKSSWVKPIEGFKEPYLSSALRNLLLSFPGCISVEESGDRFFLSDVNHHRIIIFNSDGKFLDVIGSSPGFEDGEFESAMLMRPAASFYDASEDCLYFVDSENHAIRKADMERRIVETIYPPSDANKKNNGLWRWILDKIWTKRDVDSKSEFPSESFLFPWHLMRSSDNNLFVLNRSFGTLWVMDMASGLIREVVKEPSKILEICGEMIVEKSIPLKQIPTDWLQQQLDANCPFEKIPYAGLMSSVAAYQDHVVVCNAVGQMVSKFSRKSGLISIFQFSNFGILGLPYWLSFPLERVSAVLVDGVLSGIHIDHFERFRLLPGTVDIELNIDIPQHTNLVEPLQEGCIWRQARGAATEISGAVNKATSTEKVGAAQQWYDEIDSLSFSVQEIESSTENGSMHAGEGQDGKVLIGCTVNTSPGASEVIIYAALYLRLKRSPTSDVDDQVKKATRIADVLDPTRKVSRDLLVKLLLTSNSNMEELIFIRPLHVKLKFDCLDHPKADNHLKDIILTDSSVNVNVVL